MRANEFVVEDAAAVGVIASGKQKNDPRYKTSLTVDVKPDTMKKAIAAYFPTQPLDNRQIQVHESSNDPSAVDSTSPIDGDEELDEQELTEIERLSRSDYTGGKDVLYGYNAPKKFYQLPGASGLVYNITGGNNDPTIKIWDPNGKHQDPKPRKQYNEFGFEFRQRMRDWERRQASGKTAMQLIGKLSLEKPWSGFPLKNALQVGTITVDEDYRGVGIAKALYGIVLTIMKRPLLAGSSQTPGGRRNWVSLASIPGVEMKGYFAMDDYEFTTRRTEGPGLDAYDRQYNIRKNKAAEETIDTIMGKLGGQYMGKNRHGAHYFAFDVRPNTTGQELEAFVKQNLAQVYGSSWGNDAGLYAVWTGQ